MKNMKKLKIGLIIFAAAAFVFLYPRDQKPITPDPTTQAPVTPEVTESATPQPVESPQTADQSETDRATPAKGITLQAHVVATFAPDKNGEKSPNAKTVTN